MRYLRLSLLSLLIFGCSSSMPPLPTTAEDIKETHIKPKIDYRIAKYFKKTDKKIGDKSAFYPLGKPLDALASRLFLIDNAKSTLDIQYYIFEDDKIGKVVATHILKASRRGVKVRILLDDLSTTGKDRAITALASNKNIEVKFFNPNIYRTSFRNMALILDVEKLGKRMHNKALIADGVVAIIGGRNIGDVYFASSGDTIFLDYDLLVVGSVLPDINREFSLYWSSRESKFTKDILPKGSSSYNSIEERLNSEVKAFYSSRVGKELNRCNFNQGIKNGNLKLIVADKTELYYDHPSKVSRDENDTKYHISGQLSSNLNKIKKSVVIISPYFIPSDEMVNALSVLIKRGIDVVVVTNSLSSTDVSPVYAGYKGYIKPLVEMGVKLYELKANSFNDILESKKLKDIPSISLHTKMIVIDDRSLIIGSANIDPRSNKLNTELLMIIKSKKMAKEHIKGLRSIINLNNFYRLIVKDNRVYWKTIKEKKIIFYDREPSTNILKRCGTDIMALLPIKGYL